jgi:hypothetical protein
MKRIIAVIVCLTLCLLAMSSCGSINPRHEPYGVMTAVEQIDDGSGKYTKKIELSDERIIEIFNSHEWSKNAGLNGGYDFKFIIDGREVLYNSDNGSAVEGGTGIIVEGDDKQYIVNRLIDLFGTKSLPTDPMPSRSVAVVSGANTIEPKSFISAISYTSTISFLLDQETTVDCAGCSEVYGYTEEQLKALPTITLDDKISVELSERTRVTHVIIMNLGSRKLQESDQNTTLEELSSLEAGEYYIYLGSITESDDRSECYNDVFRLIIE